jgi:hypothetical protein
MLTEQTSKLFERLFILSKGKSVKLKRRLFNVFEKLNGSSLFKKLQYFFAKNIMDPSERIPFYQSES